MTHIILLLMWLSAFSVEPVQITKCNADTGICLTYYDNCLTYNTKAKRSIATFLQR